MWKSDGKHRWPEVDKHTGFCHLLGNMGTNYSVSFNTMQSLFFSQIKTWLHENVSYVLLILFASVFEENMITDILKNNSYFWNPLYN